MSDRASEEKEIPKIYLDQNVLSMVAKGELAILKEKFISSEWQLIYFDETINEIARCGNLEFRKKALDALVEMKGIHLRVNDNESATGTNALPYQLFEEAQETDKVMLEAMQQFIFKLHGGRQGENFADVLEDQKAAFIELLNSMQESVSEIREDGDDEVGLALEQIIPIFSEMSVDVFNSSLGELNKQMSQDIPDPEGFDGPNTFQEYFEVGSEQLNNIKPPKVVEQIWEWISASEKLSEQQQNLEDFLKPFYGVTEDGVQPDWKGKIRGLYLFLNFIGYWPDKKRRNLKKFIAAQSDIEHAVYGAYSNLIISSDERFVKKISAIYEYLGISTEVFHVIGKKVK